MTNTMTETPTPTAADLTEGTRVRPKGDKYTYNGDPITVSGEATVARGWGRFRDQVSIVAGGVGYLVDVATLELTPVEAPAFKAGDIVRPKGEAYTLDGRAALASSYIANPGEIKDPKHADGEVTIYRPGSNPHDIEYRVDIDSIELAPSDPEPEPETVALAVGMKAEVIKPHTMNGGGYSELSVGDIVAIEEFEDFYDAPVWHVVRETPRQRSVIDADCLRPVGWFASNAEPEPEVVQELPAEPVSEDVAKAIEEFKEVAGRMAIEAAIENDMCEVVEATLAKLDIYPKGDTQKYKVTFEVEVDRTLRATLEDKTPAIGTAIERTLFAGRSAERLGDGVHGIRLVSKVWDVAVELVAA